MLKILIYLSMIFFSIIMFFLNHPLSMGLMILLQTLLICLISGMLIKTYWFSYILFLTFLGGLLVLFIYTSSIASNEIFTIQPKFKILLSLFLFSILFLSTISFNNITLMNLFQNLEMYNLFNNTLFFNNENKINLSKLYNNQTFLMMMLMMIYLFITLIAVVKITNIFFGPIRSSFY
ncbi:NADH dehydrogenase subunit 6 (mitochondrion) [Plodia interpunctella]|uniref:NADH-ubiquinone oxidoreductase chain 6 n=1 Tax=Plodia interpunctella TaxID=58824 RepID=A0A0M5JCP4_PLOIN|nr:NADH dehydrogenase subunit 6 [Plodia interpunctella]ALC76006.1 NADH dehydrogenase subunit 6 [Plodia interpunctella]